MKSLFLPLTSLNRVGDAIGEALERLIGGNKIVDLLLHKPLRLENIAFCPRLFEVKNDELVVLKLKVEAHIKPENPRQPFKVVCFCASGHINLVFFKIFPSQLQKMKIGSEIAVLGHISRSFVGRNMELQISHPQEILPVNEIEKMPKVNVVYPLTAGITGKFIAQKIQEILAKLEKENLEEWIDLELMNKQGWSGFVDSLKSLHYLKKSNLAYAQKRLTYDELLAWQIALLIAKNDSVAIKKFVKNDKKLTESFLNKLPFELTKSQLKAIEEISAEINSSKKMLRLLQGDVGSGKTVVALAACLEAISQNKQACVIVPITILAKQHFRYFSQFLKDLNIDCEILTSATTKKEKVKILQKLADGEIDILISTHAVLEDDVQFQNLGLAIIDEQHRFGVMQRLKLVKKGEDVDVLLMSATPIPRSLMMGLYGDMDISILSEKPKNRLEIETLVMSGKKSVEIYESIKRAVSNGDKVYWICPAIEESCLLSVDSGQLEVVDLVNVTEKHKELVEIFGAANVGLIHGKMKEKEKEEIMNKFMIGEYKILVATTVIEVGIDVGDATIILIENAEMFGLSQLHQLRGRVGRGEKKSFCILLYGEKYGKNARARLNILRESNDGFYIAEEDLKMRGSGDLLGTKQSGFPEFRIADLSVDSDLLKIAHKNAQLILHRDAKLQEVSSQKYQELLKIFNYDECLKTVVAG